MMARLNQTLDSKLWWGLLKDILFLNWKSQSELAGVFKEQHNVIEINKYLKCSNQIALAD